MKINSLLWMLTAILICGTMTMLTSCSNKDNATVVGPDPLAETLSGGAWYDIYGRLQKQKG